MKPRCEYQIGHRPTFIYNAFTIPRAVICPNPVEPGEKWCAEHHDAGEALLAKARQ